MDDLLLYIILRYIYFSNSFLFVSPSIDLWNDFTTRVVLELNMP